jgi:hypothetical protein
VRLALNLNFESRLTAFAEALLAGDLQRQLKEVEEWPDTAERKLDFLHQFFVFQYFEGFHHLPVASRRQTPENRTSPIYAVIDTIERMGDDLRDDPG